MNKYMGRSIFVLLLTGVIFLLGFFIGHKWLEKLKTKREAQVR
jgi:hypothetical protein